MIKASILAAAMALVSSCAFAQTAASWQDGVYTASAAGLFAGASPKVIAFVKAHDDLDAAALTSIQPCAGDGTDSLCHLNQQRFILDYIAAFYGDHASQQNIAYDLAGDGMPPRQVGNGNLQIGVAPDPVWACAWRIAILTSGGAATDITDLWSYKTDCESLSQADYQAAEGDAQNAITPKIRALSAHPDVDLAMVDRYPNTN